MDISGSDELNTSLESNFSEEADGLALGRADRPSPFTLRSQCNNHRCPQGAGILFRSRISPSPSKQRVRTRRRRRSDQSHLDSSVNTTLTSLTTSVDYHNHVESPIKDLRLLRSGEMIRQRSTTPRRRKATTTSTLEKKESSAFVVQNSDGGGVSPSVNGGVAGFAESVKERVLSFLTPTQDTSLPAIVESSESGFEEGNLTGGTVPTSSPASEVFVGAREFFAERESRDRLASDYFSSSDTPSRLRESTKRLSIRKPFNQYIAYSSDEELEEWQNQAKSDYTYSASLTYRDRVTPDRKIGSPNMSRRGLRGGNMAYFNSPDFSSSDLSNETDDSSHLNLRTRTILRPMEALSDTSDGEGEAVLEPVSRRTRSSRSRSTEMGPRINGSTITRTVTSYTTTRTLHRGLDADSDVDDGTESTVPQRATPFTARSGTPLARGTTPVSIANSRSSVSGDVVGRGYTLAKGAIAEDVEEEEEEDDSLLSRRILSWRSVKRITTYITTSVVMMAVRTVMSQQSDTSNTSASVSSSEKWSKYSFLSSVSSSSRQIVDAGAGLVAASRDHLKKRPILLWIPLIPLLIFLALVASWWLLQSGATTDDSADPTQTTGGPSFLSYTLTSPSEITNLVINGIYYGPILVWEAVLGLLGWAASAPLAGLSALWAAITSMAMWLGSVAHSGLAYILQTIYFILELLQIMALAVASFFSSSFSYIFGFFLPTNGSQEETENEAQSWSASAWVSSATSLSWISQAYSSVSEAAQKTQTWIWDGWLWLVISVADALTAGVSSFLWLLGFLWSLLWLMVSGLWTILAYIFTGTISLLSSAATTVTSTVVEVFSTVAGASRLVFLPLLKTSESSKNEHNTLFVSHSTPVDDPKVSVAGMSIEDIVSRVLESARLKGMITSMTSQNTDKSQLTMEEINLLVKSLVEGELKGHKVETVALWESHTKTAALETETHMLSVKEQHQDFLKQLGLLGAEVARLQDSMKVSQEGQDQHHHHLETLRSQIDELSLKLRVLENNHTNLASEVKGCCKNTSVTLADVERHVTVLLGDILGLSSSQEGAAGGSWSVADMGAWLRSYFVAKEELETRLNILTATLQKKNVEENDVEESSMAASSAAVAQSTQIIMDTVLEKLRAEMQNQQEQLNEAANQQISQQVNTQMQAAAAVLGKQVSEQVDLQLQSSKQQLKNSVTLAVEETVPKHMASAVPQAVASAVAKSVADSVPNAVSAAVPDIVKVVVEGAVQTTVNAAVGAAVSEAVAAAVPEAVNVAVPGIVSKVVENAVPQAIEGTLPNTMNAAVQEAVAAEVQGAITVAVSEVIASVLPSAVSTAVNETVASRISEALVDARLSRAGNGHAEGLNGDGMVVVSGTHSDMSHSSGATLSATVNVSNNGNNGSSLFAPVSIPMTGGLNESAVIRIVKEALLKYDADKTGMVDHALESAGGNIVSTRCTESYQVHLAELSILGVPLFRYPTNNNPRIIIQPERMPGQCWAFKGSQGYIVIKLAGSVLPTGFTIEHIPKSLSPSGEIDSAPREFEVWGLRSENDEGILLGSYEYDQNGDPFQFFAVKEANTEYFPLIELKINSNHGNLQYTCLYRFRVHGVRHF